MFCHTLSHYLIPVVFSAVQALLISSFLTLHDLTSLFQSTYSMIDRSYSSLPTLIFNLVLEGHKVFKILR